MDQSNLTAKLRAATGYDEDLISALDLNRIILAALDEYNVYRPCYGMTLAEDGIVTVADQPNYAGPTDALWIVEVAWSPFDFDDTDGTLEAFLIEMYQGTINAEHPSEVVATRQRLSKWAQLFRGTWKIINDEIWLIPPPTSNGDHVAVFYAKANALADLNTTKDQKFFELVKAYMQERRGSDLVNAAGRAGAYVVPPESARLILQEAQRNHRRVISHIARSYHVEQTNASVLVRNMQ